MTSNLKSILRSLFPASDDTRRNGVIATLVTSTSTTSACVSSPAIAVDPTIRQLASSSRGARGDRALEVAIPALSLVSAATEAIPVAGPPLKAVVNGLLVILKGFDHIRRNKEDIRRLQSRLRRLDLRISVLETSGSLDRPRSHLNMQLIETARKLREALDLPKFRFQSVAEVIEECCEDIHDYLEEDTWVTVQEIQIELRQRQKQAIQQPTSITFDIYLMDAMGVKHRIPMEMARTFEQFKRAIGGVYIPNSQRDVMHRRYLDADQFHLGIDNGNQVLEIKSDEDLQELVEPGATVVLSIILLRQQGRAKEYLCPLCKNWNNKKAIHSAAECASPGCKAYMQVTEADTRSTFVLPTLDYDELELGTITNIHLKRYVCARTKK